ncbi:SICAvar, type I [Plasmodium knowlesi strain H]|uniref:SICAvar, type I n=3 Tax=Plasmodium knowlesi TaxID=5850 RepID=A0A5K1UA23_PLAKH|nr:SICAvar, type I [Plasmodium knowlesi strain H]OTN64982.1 SICAvar type I [Plasmodium knowlesi]CAA9988364.1 SICAvar, type I [Plasmodium knowlesi strain H]SBO20034.1 SICAvar, type I [Plasmodium knowlesi strain H]SBO20324.1 SICAvar, type I [Plasmodium knowlesi strain H]VVS77838.1 SICAvar, type I [Plasmodium knowlesi strain H]|eukprot:XP_002259345.1 SICA antigen [Plasmodium knowlesi strain H]
MSSGAPGGTGGTAGSGGFLQAWLQETLKNGGPSGTGLKTGQEIRDKLKNDLGKKWDELGVWLGRTESREIANLCKDVGKLVRGAGGGVVFYLQNLCKGIAEIKYFISGVERARGMVGSHPATYDKKEVITPLTDNDKAYARCIVGSVALNELYGDHCYMAEIIQKITDDVDRNLRNHLSSKHMANLDKCKGLTDMDVLFGKSILGDTIERWKGMKRVNNGPWRIWRPWEYWPKVCNEDKKPEGDEGKAKLQQQRKENASVMTTFLKVGDDDNRTPGQPTIGEVLTNPDYTISQDTLKQIFQEEVERGGSFQVDNALRKIRNATQQVQAEACIKKNSGDDKLCSRLDCMKQLWNNKGGQTSDADALWKEVREQVTNLVTKVSDKGTSDSDAETLCSTVQCPNGSADCVSKTTCNIMVKALKEVHTVGETGQEDYRIFSPTMRCVILNALAEKLKEQAYKGGYACAVEDGITKAFEVGGTQHSTWCGDKRKGDGSCQPCGKQHRVCTGSMIIGTTSLANEVMDELNTNITNTTNIQTALDKIKEKVTLCDRMNCIIKQLNPSGTSHTQNASTTNVEEFWTKDVKNLWNELAKAMKDSNWNGKENGCNKLDNATPSEKAACNYLHAGFEKLKGISAFIKTNSTDYPTLSKDPSFRQTMGCFLLHAYAKHMKEKAICNIDAGIKEAFKSWNPTSNGPCTNGSSCIQCTWEDEDYDNCKINTNGGTTTTEVKGKLEEIINENDGNITQMLTEINEMTSLCDYMECIATHLNSPNGKNSAEKFWAENGDVKKLWKKLVEEMTKKDSVNGNVNVDCSGFDNPSAERACKYLHTAFTKLESIATSNGTSTYSTLKKDPSFVRTIGCFLLKEYAKQMKDKSKCVIDSGIEKAFKAWKESNNGNCNGGKESCVPCEWNEKDHESCTIKTNGTNGGTKTTEVKPQVEEIVNNDDPDTKPIIEDINKMKDLCDGLKCIASHLNSSTSKYSTTADKFWEKEGEVGQLWNDLFEAMLQIMDKDNGGPCGTMDDGSVTTGTANGRPATKPEKKACNYLHGGLKKLKELSKPSTPQTQNGKILDENPLLKHAMGCFLLKEYAKQMGKKSTCPIDSGLRKAFSTAGKGLNGNCNWEENLDDCKVTIGKPPVTIKNKVDPILEDDDLSIEAVTEHINERTTLCDKLQCATSKWFQKYVATNGTDKKTWCDFWNEGVKTTLEKMFEHVADKGKNNNAACNDFGDENPQSVERKACNHIAAGLQHIKNITSSGSANDQLLQRAVACIALNMYATKIRDASKDKCPIDEDKIKQMFHDSNRNINSLCLTSGSNNNCSFCTRQNEDFKDCKLSVSNTLIKTPSPSQNGTCNNNATEVKTQIDGLLNNSNIKMQPTLSNINKMDDNFCTQVQCAAKKWKSANNKNGLVGTLFWSDIHSAAEKELTTLLHHMTQSKNQEKVTQYCKNDTEWNELGHKEGKTNKAACLLFAAGLKHIYDKQKGPVKGPSFEQTMGCLFLKEYAKQLKEMAHKKKQGHSWVHPLCDIDKGINYAFSQSKDIMEETSPCNNGPNSCFVCNLDGKYEDCKIGDDSVKEKVESIFQDKKNEDHMEKTLENTVCPILITDLLTPFLPLAPVSIGLSAMAYYLWKYFGPLGKGGARFRRSPTEIPGPSVQEQLLDHVDEGASHEYQLVKERKPRSAPTRTKRSGRDPAGGGRVNRRTIIEIHFEVLDECQKGDTQLNQKDFLELLVREFMGSEFMEEEQVPKEEVLMEGIPMESVPMEGVPMELVPSLGSGFMV